MRAMSSYKLIVHSTTSIETFDYRSDLSKEPDQCIFIGYENESIMVPARLVRESDAVVFDCDTLDIGERQIPNKA